MSMSQETQNPFLYFPINTDKEVLKQYESYWEYPYYYDGDNTTTNMMSPYGGLFEGCIDSAGNIGSQQEPDLTQMNPTSGDVKNYSEQCFLSVEGSNVSSGFSDEPEMPNIEGIDLVSLFADSTEDSQLPYDNLEGLGILGEGSGIDTSCLFKNKRNIAFGSQQDLDLTQMKRTSGDVKNNSEQSFLSVKGSNVSSVFSDEPEMPNISIEGIDLVSLFSDSTEDSQLPYDNLAGLGILGEGSGIDTSCLFKNKSNIAFDSFGSIESMMNAQREKEKIEMIPTPRTVNDAPQWTITKKLSGNDINPNHNTLILRGNSVDVHIRRHMFEEDFQKITSGTLVNVYDDDMGTMHKLRLCVGKRSTYGLTGGWVGDFVRRRSLRTNDEIGLLWDSSASRLVFGVISRSTARRYKEKNYFLYHL